VEEDKGKGSRILRETAEAEVISGMSSWGVCLVEGIGVEADLCTGIGWLRKAAELGDAEAMVRLGMAHGIGEGVLKDAELAFL
jgi:TPR repeat protein